MCCGRRATGARETANPGSDGGASTGAAAGTYTVTTADGSKISKGSEIAAKLYVASHPGSSYAKN